MWLELTPKRPLIQAAKPHKIIAQNINKIQLLIEKQLAKKTAKFLENRIPPRIKLQNIKPYSIPEKLIP